MSDDAPRSTQGNRPDQRRGRGAPAWWAMLQRNDLPDDAQACDGAVDTARWDVSDALPAPRPRSTRTIRLATLASVLAAVLVALAVAVAVWVATAMTGRVSGTTVAVIVAVPAALLVTALLARLAGRRR